jgi:hypothetical protein
VPKVEFPNHVKQASIALDLNLRHEQLMSYARLLEEYSKKPPRPRPQRVESGSGVGGEGLEKQESGGGGGGIGGKIGIDLRIDTTLDHMLREVRRLDAKFIIDHRDADAMSLQGRQAVQKELSQVLPLTNRSTINRGMDLKWKVVMCRRS